MHERNRLDRFADARSRKKAIDNLVLPPPGTKQRCNAFLVCVFKHLPTKVLVEGRIQCFETPKRIANDHFSFRTTIGKMQSSSSPIRTDLKNVAPRIAQFAQFPQIGQTDRKSTRLNSSHLGISYAVFC